MGRHRWVPWKALLLRSRGRHRCSGSEAPSPEGGRGRSRRVDGEATIRCLPDGSAAPEEKTGKPPRATVRCLPDGSAGSVNKGTGEGHRV